MTTVQSRVRGKRSSHGNSHPGVLFAGNFYASEGGSLSVCEELSGRLKACGWPVITVSRKRDRVAKLADMVTTAWRERARYDVAQIDLFSGAAFVWAEAVAWTARRAGRPFILTLHGGSLPEFASERPDRVKRLLQAATAVTAPSRFLYDGMRKYRDDIVILPNALSLDSYHYRHRAVANPTIVWLRAIHDVYNPTLLPRVISRVAEDAPRIQAIMVGPDKGDGSLQRTLDTAQALGVQHRLKYVGGVAKSEVPKLLDQGDIFLNTANVDNTPVTVGEAMASGLCVVSTNVGGIPYLLDDDVNALLVPPDDEALMSNAVHRLLTEPALASRLSMAARAKAEELDWKQILPKWENLLSAAANGHV